MACGFLGKYLKSFSSFLTDRPPVAIFILFIAGLSLSCFSLAFYIQRNGGIIDYEATKVFT